MCGESFDVPAAGPRPLGNLQRSTLPTASPIELTRLQTRHAFAPDPPTDRPRPELKLARLPPQTEETSQRTPRPSPEPRQRAVPYSYRRPVPVLRSPAGPIAASRQQRPFPLP